MAAPDLSAFLDELRGVIGTAWPEVLPAQDGGGIWEAEHADKVAWADLTLPYAVMLVTGTELAEMRPLRGLVYQVTPLIIYVTAVSDDSEPLRTPLRALTDELYPAQPLTTAQRLEVGAPDWSDELRPNMVFAAANHPARAGVLPVKFLIASEP